MNAANSAYRKVRKQTRAAAHRAGGTHPVWFTGMVDLLPDVEEKQLEVQLTDREQKEEDHAKSEDWYERLAWQVFDKCTSAAWFEMFIMSNILLVGVVTGIELESGDNASPQIVEMVEVVNVLTLASFTMEIVLKVVAEGYAPWRFFT